MSESSKETSFLYRLENEVDHSDRSSQFQYQRLPFHPLRIRQKPRSSACLSYVYLIYTRTDTQADPSGGFHMEFKGDQRLIVVHTPPQMSRTGKKFDRVFVGREWYSRTGTKAALQQMEGQEEKTTQLRTCVDIHFVKGTRTIRVSKYASMISSTSLTSIFVSNL